MNPLGAAGFSLSSPLNQPRNNLLKLLIFLCILMGKRTLYYIYYSDKSPSKIVLLFKENITIDRAMNNIHCSQHREFNQLFNQILRNYLQLPVVNRY